MSGLELCVPAMLLLNVCLDLVRMLQNKRDRPVNFRQGANGWVGVKDRLSRRAVAEIVNDHVQPNSRPGDITPAIANFDVFIGRHRFHSGCPLPVYFEMAEDCSQVKVCVQQSRSSGRWSSAEARARPGRANLPRQKCGGKPRAGAPETTSPIQSATGFVGRLQRANLIRASQIPPEITALRFRERCQGPVVDQSCQQIAKLPSARAGARSRNSAAALV